MMTKSEVANAIIYEVNQSFLKKDKYGHYLMKHDINESYSDILCILDRYEKQLLMKIKKRKYTKQKDMIL